MPAKKLARRFLPPVAFDAVRRVRRRRSPPAPVRSDAELLREAAEPLAAFPPSEEQRAIPIPPAELRRLVVGQAGDNPHVFLPAGQRAHRALLEALDAASVDIDRHRRVLDWGCGCGRVTRHWLSLRETHRVHGCDINAELISWCREHLPHADYRVCDLEPPAPYDGESFDLVFGGSVLTHLDLEGHVAWMRELWRLLAPGGVAVLTFHGPHYLATHLSAPGWQGWLIDGELFAVRGSGEGSNAFASAATEGAMRRLFTPFEVLWYGPLHSIMGAQDTLVLRRSGAAQVLDLPSVSLDGAATHPRASLPVAPGGRTRLVTFARQTGEASSTKDKRPLAARISLCDESGTPIDSVSLHVENPRDRTLHSATLEGDAGWDRATQLVFEAQSAVGDAGTAIHFEYTSLY